MQRIDVVYVRPTGDHRGFEVRLSEVAHRFGSRVTLTMGPASALARVTRERVFLSRTLPNVIVARDGEVIAEAIGDLPAREIESLLCAAIEGSKRAASPTAA